MAGRQGWLYQLLRSTGSHWLSAFLVVDTNIYIRAFREEEFGAEFRVWHAVNARRLAMSTVVLYELMVGAAAESARHRLEADYVRPFRRMSRLLTPSQFVWEKASAAEAELRAKKRHVGKVDRRGFGNDLLIALTCRAVGATLITANVGDFELIRSVTGVRYDSGLV